MAAVERGRRGQAGQGALGPRERQALIGVDLADPLFVLGDRFALGGQVVGLVMQYRRLR
ncbi:hypothetical protein ACIO14_31765 [Nocardia fluminea]|uniref:hypothetical protein n=1 Tax=Nocardia fluminea TaxID=134984 RepID=UPI0038081493